MGSSDTDSGIIRCLNHQIEGWESLYLWEKLVVRQNYQYLSDIYQENSTINSNIQRKSESNYDYKKMLQ